jgi:hypothetical protein
MFFQHIQQRHAAKGMRRNRNYKNYNSHHTLVFFA